LRAPPGVGADGLAGVGRLLARLAELLGEPLGRLDQLLHADDGGREFGPDLLGALLGGPLSGGPRFFECLAEVVRLGDGRGQPATARTATPPPADCVESLSGGARRCRQLVDELENDLDVEGGHRTLRLAAELPTAASDHQARSSSPSASMVSGDQL
jgi:hypothetical protein